jgi:hypothetical protein
MLEFCILDGIQEHKFLMKQGALQTTPPEKLSVSLGTKNTMFFVFKVWCPIVFLILLSTSKGYLRKNRAGGDFGEDNFTQQSKSEFARDNPKFTASF